MTTTLERKRRKRISTSANDDLVSNSKKKRDIIEDDDVDYSSSSSPITLNEDCFEPGGPLVGPKTKAIIQGSSSKRKRKTITVTIELQSNETKKKRIKRNTSDSDDFSEEIGSNLGSGDEKSTDENIIGESRREAKKSTQVLESDSESNSDDSEISTPWLKKAKKRPLKETTTSANTNLDSADKTSSLSLTIPKKIKPPLREGTDQEDIPKKKKKSSSHKISSSKFVKEEDSETPALPLKIPKKNKISKLESNEESSTQSSTSNTKISRKEKKMEVKSDSLIANLAPPKIDKPSASKNPSKSSLNHPSNNRSGEKATHSNWKGGGGMIANMEGNASRSKMNAQERHRSTWNSQVSRQQGQSVQQNPPGSDLPTKKPTQSGNADSEKILKYLDKVIRQVKIGDIGGKTEKLASVNTDSNNRKEPLFKNGNPEEDDNVESYDFFDKNDDGSIIIDNIENCLDSDKKIPLSWWGVITPPDNILSMYNNEKNEKKRNMETFYPRNQHQHYGNGPFNNSHYSQSQRGKDLEGQKLVHGDRRRNDGMRKDWGNGRGRGSHWEERRGGSDRY